MMRIQQPGQFRLGLFATNCAGGLAITKAPERWVPSWENNVAAARLAEAVGLEFMLPIARWHGYGGEINSQGNSLETLTWAAGLLASTKKIDVFSTIHVPFVNPVFAAKQAMTVQAIGQGRFGLNIVAGGNEPEFAMFGIDLLEHDERYAYAAEWNEIVKKIWTETTPFNYNGRFFKLQGVIGEPKPYAGEAPMILSAGSSGIGRDFAVRHADSLFMNIVAVDTLAGELADLRATLPSRRLDVFASGHVICRPTASEARDYHHYIVHETGDWDALEHIFALRKQQKSVPMERLVQMKERLIGGTGTFPLIGTPDEVAAQFNALHTCGIDGMAIGFIDYIKELPYFADEVLPRMVRLGLRSAE
jgi:FMNH2-dependent dimethyl sulfone monooxygenase